MAAVSAAEAFTTEYRYRNTQHNFYTFFINRSLQIDKFVVNVSSVSHVCIFVLVDFNVLGLYIKGMSSFISFLHCIWAVLQVGQCFFTAAVPLHIRRCLTDSILLTARRYTLYTNNFVLLPQNSLLSVMAHSIDSDYTSGVP